MVGRIAVTVFLVLVVIYVVPFAVYGAFAVLTGLKPPEGVSPQQFLLSVLVSKLGTAVAFVLILHFAGGSLRGRWLLYALLWWVMFTVGEAGQVIGPNYSWKEALAGIISETIYFPLAACLTHRLLCRP